MGVERVVRFPTGAPDLVRVLAEVRAAGLTPVVRMLDGLPAFPDEEPTAECAELRLSLPAGMVTLRRTADAIAVVVWGTADRTLIDAQAACAAACERAGPT